MKKRNIYTKKRVKKGAYINSSITKAPKRKFTLSLLGGAEGDPDTDSLDNLDISQISQNPSEEINIDIPLDDSFEGNNNSMHLSELDVPSDFNRTDSLDNSSSVLFDDSDDYLFGNQDNFLEGISDVSNQSAETTKESDISGGKRKRVKRKLRKSKKSERKTRSKRQRGGILNNDIINGVKDGDLAIVQQALNDGANVNAKIEDGGTHYNSHVTLLILAIRKRHTDIVELLLSQPDILVNEKDSDGKTALIWASWNGLTYIVELLLSQPNILVNEKDNSGRTALFVASFYGRIDIVELLLAQPDILVNEKDNSGRTALMLANLKGHARIVELLEDFKTNKEKTLSEIKSFKRPNISSLATIASQQVSSSDDSVYKKYNIDRPYGKLGGKRKTKKSIKKRKKKSRKSNK
jgi:ankyrin repeat protein